MLTTTVHFHAGCNTPGFEPEPDSERAFLDAEVARGWLTTQLLQYVQVNTDRHDCAGADCAEPDCDYASLVYRVSAIIAALWGADSPTWAAIMVDGDVWWTTACDHDECLQSPDEVTFRAFLDAVKPEDFNF